MHSVKKKGDYHFIIQSFVIQHGPALCTSTPLAGLDVYTHTPFFIKRSTFFIYLENVIVLWSLLLKYSVVNVSNSKSPLQRCQTAISDHMNYVKTLFHGQIILNTFDHY